MDASKLAKALGKLGGQATKKKHGSQFYKQISAKGGAAVKAKYGPDYFKRIRQGQKIKPDLNQP